MASVLSTGQITIIDYNDALSLTSYITSNKTKTQMFNPDNGSYNPDWSSSSLVLTPSLFKLGTSTDIISTNAVTSITWWDVTAGTETSIVTNAGLGYAVGGAKPNALTINKNLLAGLTGKDFMCKIIYHDDSTNLDLTVKTDITFSRVVNGSGIADAICWLPDGNVFKNDSVTSLRAQCDMWRGSVIDTTNVTYKWFSQDPAQATDVGGGIGWKACTETANVTTGVTSSIMTIFPNAVATYEVFKCVITDTDSASNTYNQTFKDTCTIADQSDPIQCSVVSSGGEVFKNGTGSSTLTAKLFQAGAEIDSAGTKYTYKWYKYDNTGALVALWGGATNYKTGKTLAIGGADVDTKATFNVEVEG